MGLESTSWTQIRGAAAGSAAARDGFVRRYEPAVRAYLAARWGRGPQACDVDDGVQEVFLECFRAGGAIQRADPERGSFRAYLYGLARNVARRFEAKRAGRREGAPHPPSALDELAAEDESVSRAFDRGWAQVVMRQAAERQAVNAHASGPSAEKRVELLRLRFEAGQPIRDIAARWQVDPAWLHHEYARARREFREAVLAVVREIEPESAPEEEAERLLALLGRESITVARK